jgi:hypothetical protein
MIYNTNLLPFVKNGYFVANEQVYSSKLQALIAGSKTGEHPQWVFNNDIFDKVPWTIEPTESVDALYRQRAINIRSKANYVVLLYSAGVDSHTVFTSFVDTGKPVDEIVITWPVAAAEKFANGPEDKSTANTIAEWTYLIEPQLKFIKETWPSVKITVIDSTEGIVDNNYTEEDFFKFETFYSIGSLNRWPQALTELKQISAEHPGTVVVMGLDKPQLKLQNNKLYLFFLDKLIQIKSDECIDIEYFYWSPDATDLLRKQAHLVLNHFRHNPQLIPLLEKKDSVLLDIINRCIYPVYDPNRFQAKKQEYVIYNEQFYWLAKTTHDNKDQKVDRWVSDLTNFNLVIEDRYKQYKDNLFDGYVGFVSPFYFIGNIHE